MSIYIIGSGPTGLTLAWLLRNQDKKIVILEKYKDSGGTWAARWSGDLFTHHSPQILTTSYTNTFSLWKEMDIDYDDFLTQFKSDPINLTFKYTSFSDKLALLGGFIRYMLKPEYYKHITVKAYFQLKLSQKAWRVVYHLCYVIDGVPPSVMTMYEFFGIFDKSFLYKTLEMSKPSDSGFAKQWVEKLKSYENISFRYNTEVNSIQKSNEDIKIKVNGGEEYTVTENDLVIISTDPLSLVKILEKSSDEIKNNWIPWENLKKLINKGLYVSLSVQYHFGEEVNENQLTLPYEMSSGINSDWGVICVKLPFSNTISCSVINMESYSPFLKKKVSECNPEEVKEEVWRQLSKQKSLPKFQNATIGTDSTWNNGKWSFDISSASKTVLGSLEAYGEMKNVAIVNSLNFRKYPATTMESAVESAVRFVGGNPSSPRKISTYIKIVTMLLFIIVISIVCFKLKGRYTNP